MNIRQQDHSEKHSMYCIIKCIVRGKQASVQKRRFASSVLHSCNAKTQICVTFPQCVNYAESHDNTSHTYWTVPILL
jgi:hypothetical protein